MSIGKYQYIIELRDKISSQLNAIGKVMQATGQGIDKTRQGTKSLGSSLGQLRKRIELLRAQKELINPNNVSEIRQLNKEINTLENKLSKLDNVGRGGNLKNLFNELKSSVAGIALNPIALGAAATGFSVKSAMSFEEGMSKVNITAQLAPEAKKRLADEITDIATKYNFDLAVAPSGFEKIISQTGDVKKSLNILDASIKATRAGFVDLDTVSAAAAQTVSITGADANEILDAFFASKRVGAGEFADFANYMPGLIASADTLGVRYKDVAGIFAYMTGKGQSAERASVLMGNMFSMLQRSDVTEKLKANGVTVFDKAGKLRDMVDIFRDLGKVMAPLSDQQASAFMQEIGITDKEAKSAFSIMKSDIDKLNRSMSEVRNSSGEMDKALELASNPVQQFNDGLNKLKNIGTSLGIKVMPFVCTVLDVLGVIIDAVSVAVDVLSGFIGGWISLIQEGNPIIIGLTALLGALTLAMNAQAIVAGAVRMATTLWTGAQWLLNAALSANPIGAVIAIIVALIAVIVFCVTKVEGWGKQWESLTNFMKLSWQTVVAAFKHQWTTFSNLFLIGLDRLKIGWYVFKEALGFGDSDENRRMIGKLNADIEERKKAIAEGAKEVATLAGQAKDSLTWELSIKEGGSFKDTMSEITGTATGMIPDNKIGDISMFYNGMAGNKIDPGKTPRNAHGKNESSLIDLNKITDMKGSANYNAIAAKLAPAIVPSMSVSTALPSPSTGALPPATVPLPSDNSASSQNGSIWNRGKAAIQKICDTIEIHIANADGKGYDTIREEVSKVLLEVIADYA